MNIDGLGAGGNGHRGISASLVSSSGKAEILCPLSLVDIASSGTVRNRSLLVKERKLRRSASPNGLVFVLGPRSAVTLRFVPLVFGVVVPVYVISPAACSD